MKKRFLASILFLSLALGVFSAGSALAASPFDAVCSGAANNSAVCQSKNNSDNPISGKTGVLSKVTQVVALITAITSIIIIIISGIRFVTSSGDPNTVTAARNTILYASIGLVVAGLAQSIVVFVLNKI